MKPTLGQILIAVGVLIAAIVVLIFAWNFDPFGRRKNAETKAANATAQAATTQATTQATDHYIEHTTIIREKADHAVQTVQQAPGADTPIDPARRAVLCAALASVRDGPVCLPDPDGPSDPAQAVRGPDKPSAHPG